MAFFVAAIVLVWLVQSAISSSGAEEASPPAQSGPTVTEPGTTTTTTGTPKKKKFYRVRNGDTLESIAAKSDTTVEELTRLNPGIDPLLLNPGQRIRIA